MDQSVKIALDECRSGLKEYLPKLESLRRSL
jgi:hypothetical protein